MVPAADLMEAAAIAQARESYWAFRRYMFPRMKRGWWQRAIAAALQQFWQDLKDGKRPKLLIQAPRQHGKTRQVVEFLAWAAGKDPDLRTIYASFSDRLGVRANLTMQRIIASPRYRRVFPETVLQMGKTPVDPTLPASQRTQDLVEYVGREGSFRNTTVAGSVNGEGLDIGVVDDPLKGRKEANSKTARDTAWHWFATDFMGCFADQAGLLVIATRRHVDDPTGRMIQEWGPALRVVSHAAIATRDEPHRREGEALFPELKSLEFLLGLRATMSSADWDATMQQDPRVQGGNIVKGEWFRFYDQLPVLRFRVVYADTALKTGQANDFSVFQCWGIGKDDGRLYLVDQIRGKWEAPELERRVKAFWAKLADADPVKWGQLRQLKVEDKASGTGLIQKLSMEGRIPVVGIPRGVDKYSRMQDVLGYIEAGHVWLPAQAPFTSDLVAEAEAFTADGSHLHDDQLDPLMDAISDNLAVTSSARQWENLA